MAGADEALNRRADAGGGASLAGRSRMPDDGSRHLPRDNPDVCEGRARGSTGGYVAPVTDGARPRERSRFPTLEEDPERPPISRRWWLVAAVAGVVATAVTVAVILTQTSSSGHPMHGPSAPAAVRLSPAARPLPGATDGDAESFGVLGPAGEHSAHISRRQALQRYDRTPGAVSRRGSERRVLTALVRAAFINGGIVRQGTYWIISVWFHPPDIGVSPQHQWCVDHLLLNAATGRAGGSVNTCLARGKGPRAVY
jgi:hypothetical protein